MPSLPISLALIVLAATSAGAQQQPLPRVRADSTARGSVRPRARNDSTTRRPDRLRAHADSTRRPDRPGPWSLYTAASNVYESNIDHNQSGLDSYGILLGIGGAYRSSGGAVELTYDGVLRDYSHTDEWNRPGHQLDASLTQRVAKHWNVGVQGEVSINGSSEDRVLRNEYSVEPLVDYRFNRANRLRLYGEYLLKRYPIPTGQDAVDPRVGIQFRQTLGGDRSWALSGRYEVNHADSTRFRYNAWTLTANAANPTGARGRVWGYARYRVRLYTSRLVTVGGTDVLRRDRGWIAIIGWEYALWKQWALGLNYRYELYNSNDARKEFRAHTVAFTWTRRW